MNLNAKQNVQQKLQEFSHDQSNYERPNLNRTNVSIPTFDAVVEPKMATGADERSQVELALPSLRARRGSFTLAMTALTIGFLLVAMNSPWSNEFLAPGPLSSPHAQLLAGQGVERCAACHGAASESFAGWISGHHGSTAQSVLCMKCHENTLDAAFALQPHGVSPEQLVSLSGKNSKISIGSGLVSMVGLSHGNDVACSVCHQEHHGNVSLSKLTDQQCQSCHSQTFHSFETDHPEFNQWPQVTRQNIAFDHGTHLKKHFKNAQVEFNCKLCHVGDDQQKVQLMASFEQACGSCHAQQIADSGQSGWKLFTLPRLDMAAIENLKLDVGNWPAAATGDFDGDLPPMMKMLLAGDQTMHDTLSRMRIDFSFGDVDIDDADSVALAVDLVWGIKRLLHELSQHGQAAIDRRLSVVMGERYSPAISRKLLAGLNPKIFAATEKRWLPNVADELQSRRTQQMSMGTHGSPMHLTAYARPAKPMPRAQELLAENPLAGSSFESSPVVSPEQTETDERRLGKSEPETTVASPSIPAASAGPSELLAINPLKREGADVAGSEPPSLPDVASVSKPRQPKITAALPKELAVLPEVGGVALKSGWYRDDRLLEIGYRPVSHADVVVMSWSNCIGHVENADTNAATSSLFAKVNSSTAAGACRSCHTVNRTDGNVFKIAWFADRRDDSRASFTKFSHRPHLTQWSIRECSSCHRMDDSVSLVGTFDDCDRGVGMSNFHPIVKADCVSCHQKGRTQSGCMQCHNYHVGKH